MCSKEPPKEAAHSRYRVNDAIPLRQRSQTLSRAHLRSSDLLMLLQALLQPLHVGPFLLQHPVDIATQFARGGTCRLRFALRPQQMAIVRADRPRRQLERLYNLDENPLEPVIAHLRQWAVRRLAARTPRRWHQAGTGRQLVTRPKAIGANLRLEEQCAEDADARNRCEAARRRIRPGGPLHRRVKSGDFFRQYIMQME